MGDSADRREFWHQLGTDLGRGVPLLTCLRRSAAVFGEAPFAVVLHEVAAEIAGGATLSAAMAARPAWFGRGAVKIVEGGELLGIVDRAALMVAEFAAECPDCVAWRGQG